jgi:hypothetical protein
MRLLSLAFALALPAAAQVIVPPSFSCTSAAGATPKQVRAEGKAELTNDVVVTCTGGFPTGSESTIYAANFTLTFNAAVTSKIIGPGNRSEALVLIDEPAPGAQWPCTQSACTSFGNSYGFGYYGAPPSGNPNIYEGVVGTGESANTITWHSIPVDPPGSGTRTFRFTNLRLDPSSVEGSALVLTSIAVSGEGSTSIGGPLTLANAQAGLATTVRSATNTDPAPAGVPVPLVAAGSPAVRVATLRFSPRFAGAARPRTQAPLTSLNNAPAPVNQNFPGAVLNTETGFYNSTLPSTTLGAVLSSAGLADWGTRLTATITEIPPNVTVFVSLRNDGAALVNAPVARLVTTDVDGAGSFAPTAGDGTMWQLTTTAGQAKAVWEVLANGLSGVAPFDFAVYFAYPPGIVVPPPPINVRMGYAPRAGGIPRFTEATASQVLATFTAPPPPLPPPPPAQPILSVAPGALSFTGTAGGQNPAAQSIFVTGSPSPLGYGLVGAGTLPFLFSPASGLAPGSSSVTVNTRGMHAGTYTDTITVFGSQTQALVTVTLTLLPGPLISALDPSSMPAGSPGFSLNISGANFTRGTVVLWNGSQLATTFVNAGQLTAAVSAALIATAGTASITAITPDGAVSNAVSFRVVPFRLDDISPRSVAAGGAAFTLTATGSGFVPGSILTVGGAAVALTSQSSTQLTGTVAASAIAQAGTLGVRVSNPGGLNSNELALTVTERLTLTAISPAAVTATGPAFVLTLTGTGFVAGAVVQVGNASLTPSSLSRAQIQVTVPASAIAEPGALPVRVTQGAESSTAQTLTVRPAPRITSLNPSGTTAGSVAFTLVVSGSNLTNGSTVRWNGQSLSTTFGSSSSLSAQVPAALVAAAGTASVTVVTEDGVSSNALTFTIAPAVSISGLNPATANAGSPAFTLTVAGANFSQGAQVVWNGQPLPTTFVGAAQLTAQVAASLVAAVGTANVAVTSGGVTTSSLPFRIVLPPLTNVGLTAPGTAPSGQDQTVTLTFTGTFPVELRGTLTLTFTPDTGLPDDPAVQFQNGARTLSFTVPAGAPPTIPAVVTKTGTVAGVITITLAFATATGETVAPAGVTPQRIVVPRAVPGIASLTCARNASGFTATIDGFTNTREATQATFDFVAASGQSLGTTQLVLQTGSLFSGFFGSAGGLTAGGVFRYTQPFTVQGSATNVASLTVRLGNAVGSSATASCQLP